MTRMRALALAARVLGALSQAATAVSALGVLGGNAVLGGDGAVLRLGHRVLDALPQFGGQAVPPRRVHDRLS